MLTDEQEMFLGVALGLLLFPAIAKLSATYYTNDRHTWKQKQYCYDSRNRHMWTSRSRPICKRPLVVHSRIIG